MPLSAATVWEIRTAGADTNGGGFTAGAAGTDYSQQNSKNTVGADISTTDAVGIGTTTLTSLTANFGTTIVGNVIYLQGGTGTLAAGWYRVTARASATSITLDRSVPAGTGIIMNIGGALASIGAVGAIAIASNTIWIKTGAYTITSATPNVSGGCMSLALSNVKVEGYSATRGDLGTPPVLTASGISTFTVITMSSSDSMCRNITVDGASLTSSRAFSFGRVHAYLLLAKNCTNSGFSSSAGYILEKCAATGCSTQPAFAGVSTTCFHFGCEAYDNTVTGFSDTAAGGVFVRCLAYNNTGASSDGFGLSTSTSLILNCVSYANGRDGFSNTSQSATVLNSIAESNAAGVGFNFTGVNAIITNCGVYSNATPVVNSGSQSITTGTITATGSFFVDAPNDNFALNNTAGAGASARAAGLPGTFPASPSVGYLDIGAVQHADPAATVGVQMARVFTGM